MLRSFSFYLGVVFVLLCVGSTQAEGVYRATIGGYVSYATDPSGPFPDVDENDLFTAGRLVGKYRKQELGHESVRNVPGNRSPTFRTPYGRIGLMICADRRYPELVKRLCDGGLRVRLWVMIDEPNAALAGRLPQYRIIGAANHHLTVRAIKRFMDGALGTHGAWLLEPYDDLPHSTGLNTTAPSIVRQTARLAMQHKFQLCVHAISPP